MATKEPPLDAEIINVLRDALNATSSSAATVSVPTPMLRAALERLMDATAASGGTRSPAGLVPAVSLWTKAEIMAEQSPATSEVLVKLRIHTANLWAPGVERGNDVDESPWYTMTISLADDFIKQYTAALKQVKAWNQQASRRKPS